MKLLPPLLALALLLAALHTGESWREWIDPLPVEAAVATIRVPSGYHVELVAGEPMIEEPVMCAWDGDGRMYVAEMRSFMQDVHGTGAKTVRNGRIKRLEDTDNDGVMDKATVFADGLLLPRMILPLDDRILVQETDDTSLYSFRDTDGDGVADEKVLMWKGQPLRSSIEHQDSGLTWAIDNWMYTAQGGTRHRFTRGKWETGRCEGEFNQWGLGMDDVGTLFFSVNTFPARGFQQPWYAWNLIAQRARGRFTRPSLGPTDTDDAFWHVYPVHAVGDRTDKVEVGFTSACGLSIYRGDAMPDLAGDLFSAEPCSHMVRRAKITATNGKLTLRNAHDKAEFFASTDFYCRPVWTATGPDGCLYVVDMYRGIIQDSPWVGPEFVDRIQKMGADQVRGRGRIWRIAPDNFKRPAPPRLLEQTPAQRVEALASPNGWTRDTAQRLIILRGDRSVAPALESMARAHPAALARLHALWTLEGLDALTPPTAFAAQHDSDPRVRAAAVRLTEPWLKGGDPAALAAATSLAADPDVTVCRQLILSLGFSADPQAVDTIEAVIERHLDNEIIYLAGITALWNRQTPLIGRMLDGSAFRNIADASTRAAAQARWKAGIASWTGQARAPRPLDDEAVRLLDQGAAIYAGLCASCHGPDGKGVQVADYPKLAPPLDGSPRVAGQKERLIRIALHGLQGPVDGKTYEAGQMMPLAANDDAYLAAVLTYVRQEWGNDADPIRPADVAATRKLTAGRDKPWTLPELDRFAAPALAERGAWRAFAGPTTKPLDFVPSGKGGVWQSAAAPGRSFTIDLGAAYDLTAIILDAGHPNRSPQAWQLQISQDGQTWSAAVARGDAAGQLTAITFEPLTARYVRITQTAPSGERWQIANVTIHGRPR